MTLPHRFPDGLHLLYVTAQPASRLGLYQQVVSSVAESGDALLALVDDLSLGCVESLLELSGVPGEAATVVLVDDVAGDSRPSGKGFCRALDQLVSDLAARTESRRITLLVDLDGVFSRCERAGEVMNVARHLQREHAAGGTVVVSVVSVDLLPRSLPDEFFTIHGVWAFGSIPGRADSHQLDRTAERLALASPEFRRGFLDMARDDAEGALRLVPRFLDDYRRGILMLDRHLTVRFCSAGASELLGHPDGVLVDRPVSACIDGVDLVTLRHECAKLAPGRPRQTPFVVSWRAASGAYEPREVTVDPVRSGHQTVGYVVAVSRPEPVRGPRASYQQLQKETAAAEGSVVPAGDNGPLTDGDAISGDLQGTQITRREHEIILLILRRLSNREISDQLRIAEVTVKKHLTSIYRKLRVTDRNELIRSFARPGGAQ